MSKLKSLVAEAIKSMSAEINLAAEKSLEVTAKATTVELPKAAVVSASLKSAGVDAQRIGELGYIAKAARGGVLADADMKDLDGRFKAVGLTSDIASLLPTGFTGAMTRDIQARLVVTALFPYKETTPGQYDSIALNGITGFMTAENVAGTESTEAYTTMVYLVKKCMAVVKKSYEALDDSLIPLAEEVRMGIIDALARSIENAVINGDSTATHMDDATIAAIGANDYRRAFKGLRRLALSKGTADAGGAAMTEANWLTLISAAQEKGGVYLDDMQASQGKVVLLVSQNVYNQLRMLPSFLTKEKAAGNATLFGAPVDSVFGIPVIMTPYIPVSVNATGVVDAIADNNTKAMAVMLNRDYFKYYTTGAAMLESDKDVYTQFVGFAGSLRAGFNGLFDRVDTNPTAVDATRKTAIAIVNIAKV